MLDSVNRRWLLAIGGAFAAALTITLLLSRPSKPDPAQGEKAAVVWKARTGVDLAVLPRLHPAHADSDDARGLDLLLQPLGLALGTQQAHRPVQPTRGDADLDGLRAAIRASIRASTTDGPALPADLVRAVEARAETLDAVAEFVATHHAIRWGEDFAPRPQGSKLRANAHLDLHRLLAARAMIAIDRNDLDTARRMLRTSQLLGEALAEREELLSQFMAVAVERMQLAVIRRGGAALGELPAEPHARIRERYVAGMSAEAAIMLTSAREGVFTRDGSDGAERVLTALAGPKLERAAIETVTVAAEGVQAILAEQDDCAALGKRLRKPHAIFADEFALLNAREAWRRFAMLELDRAVTAALLTGRAASPCSSVTIAVRDAAGVRTVETLRVPGDSDNVIAVPSVVTARLTR